MPSEQLASELESSINYFYLFRSAFMKIRLLVCECESVEPSLIGHKRRVYE
jgi:hypothetical protein